MRLILVRHGQTPSNVKGLLDTGAPGPGLTPLGERQAAAIPAAFGGRPFEVAAVSPLLRTTLTATPLLDDRALTPMEHAGLREIAAGDMEMLGDQRSVHAYMHTVFSWVEGDVDRRMPGGESGTEFVERYDTAVSALAGTGAEDVVLFSHGAAIRTWVSMRVRGADRIGRVALPNTGYIEVEGDARGGWELVEARMEPAGGAHLESETAPDPTGDAIEE